LLGLLLCPGNTVDQRLIGIVQSGAVSKQLGVCACRYHSTTSVFDVDYSVAGNSQQTKPTAALKDVIPRAAVANATDVCRAV
jgi:hypothetical protein